MHSEHSEEFEAAPHKLDGASREQGNAETSLRASTVLTVGTRPGAQAAHLARRRYFFLITLGWGHNLRGQGLQAKGCSTTGRTLWRHRSGIAGRSPPDPHSFRAHHFPPRSKLCVTRDPAVPRDGWCVRSFANQHRNPRGRRGPRCTGSAHTPVGRFRVDTTGIHVGVGQFDI